MAEEYVLPQVTVKQNFAEITTATIKDQPVLVIGPRYDVYRYGESDTEFTLAGTAVSSWTNIAYPNSETGVDNTWDGAKVFGRGVVLAAKLTLDSDDSAAYDKILYTNEFGETVEKSGSFVNLVSDADYNKVSVGDILKYNDSEYTIIKTYMSAKISADGTVGPFIELSDSIIVSGTTPVPIDGTIHTKLTETEITGFTFGSSSFSSSTPKVGTDNVSSAEELHVSWRKLNTQFVNSIGSVSKISDVSNLLGAVNPDNPLAYGTYMAKLNSGDTLVYFVGTFGDTTDAYADALSKAALSSDVYILCPLTQDPVVLDAVKAHIDELSRERVKMWRIAFICANPDNETKIYAGTSVSYFAENTIIFKNQFGILKDVHAKTDIHQGDSIVLADKTKFTVAEVITNQKVRVLEAVDDTLSNADVSYVSHKLTGSERAERIASKSSYFASRRMYNIFPTSIHVVDNGEMRVVSGVYGACAAAGLCSSTLPQQPLTNMAITGIADVPETYAEYSMEDLNTMAAGGTFILCQNLPEDRVYVRHQISTATSEGNLLTRELSITKNIDSICYYFADTFEDLIGKYNITPELLRIIELRFRTALDYLENSTSAGLYGPQLLEEGTRIVEIKQNEITKDHVDAVLQLNPPKPFNNLDIVVNVI